MPAHGGGVNFMCTLHTVLDFFMPTRIGSAQIYPNQLGTFRGCDNLRVAGEVPEQLRVALRELSAIEKRSYYGTSGQDLRGQLVDLGLTIDHKWESLSLESVCGDVDSHISRLFADSSYHTNQTFKRWVAYVNRTWFDSNSREGPQLFPRFATSRGLIVCEVIFDKETRDLVSEFAALSMGEIRMLIDQIRQFKSLKLEVDRLRTTLVDLQKQIASIPRRTAG
jgi:hypothetical protein